MNNKRSIQLRKLGVIILCWCCIGVMLTIYDHYALHSDFSKGPQDFYNFKGSLFFHVSAAFIGSVLGGTWLVFFVNERMRDRPYYQSILAVVISFLFVVTFITVVLGFFFVPVANDVDLNTAEGKSAYYSYLFDPKHFKNILSWFCVTMLTQFTLSINDKFGHGILWKFIIGRYHRPKQEQRIFMFVDIKSSTTIAEKLGNDKYYNLLRDFFADITDDIINSNGEIYQYVGDEIIISWEQHVGLKNNRCIQCFFDMRKTIETNSKKYLSRYGLTPEFKAGIHFGNVTAGEIGIIKRDITYSGDVLNTTARIQGLCNEYKVNILISNDLLNIIPDHEKYNPKEMGSFVLRGKRQDIKLSTLS